MRVDEVTNRGGLGAPVLRARAGKLAGVGQPRRAVQRDPAHRLRLGVVPRGSANLPDAGVGLAPVSADEVGHAREVAAAARRQRVTLTGNDVVVAAAIAPDGANTSSFSASALRTTASRQGPV